MEKRIVFFLTLLFFGITVSCRAQIQIVKHKTQNVSMLADHISIINLIATPEKYDGKLVCIIGYLNLEFEGDEIYLHKEDYDHGNSKNAIWVALPYDILSDSVEYAKKILGYSKKYVIIIGTFKMNEPGSMGFGLSSGMIEDIARLDVYDN